MSEQNTPDPVDPIITPGGNDEPKKTVDYETHRKLLDEKKKTAAELAQYKKAEEDRKAKELSDAGEFQKIIELKDKELAEKNGKLTEMQQRESDRLKLSRLLSALPGTVDKKFYEFMGSHIDQIVVNPDTGEVDEMSVTKAAEDFRLKFPEWIQTKKSGLPNGAPQGGANTISRAEWNKLSSKEMMKWKAGQITD